MINEMKNGSVVELMTSHTLGEDCKCSPEVFLVSKKLNNGYAQYATTKRVVHN